MGAAPMLLELHERGTHAVWTGREGGESRWLGVRLGSFG